jgi:non-specific serine/threonine protein kinase
MSPPGGAAIPANPDKPAVTRVGRYPVLRELGRGGMGVVYLVEDPTLGRTVALKHVPESFAQDAARLERFRQEARLLASLNHPNIATIHSLEEADGVCFLTMEAIAGETLADRLKQTPLALEESLRIARQIARAVETAHKRGIVHRDLKPGNIMFTPDLDVKVLDFGLASFADATVALGGAGTGSESAVSEVSGTPGYMSPEQIEGAASDPRMDVWAFGCILFECLTGKRAIRGKTLKERLQRTSADRPDLNLLPTESPAALREMLKRCLAHGAAERYPSMTEPRQVVEELLAELAFQPGQADPSEDRAAIPNNLPRHGSTFIGRTAEVAGVANLLADHRLVTLTGIGGAGKTRLALRVAESLLGTTYDGIWFVELAPLSSSEDIAGTIMVTLGIPESLDRTPIQAVAARLAAGRTLLLIDNCEHVIEGAARIASTLLRDAPGLRILATSRERLAVDGEVCYAIPLLELPDRSGPLDVAATARCAAVELFLQRARQVGATIELNESNAPAIVEICRRLDGIPLAIELAASRLKMLGVEDVLRRMDDRFRLLTGGARGDLPHHRTLRALIDWSYEQLDSAERALLQRLSVFAGGWTLEAAEAVAAGGEVNGWDILDLSSRLVDKSLIVAEVASPDGAIRFRMLETVRAYAAERLGGGDEGAEIRRRHRDYFVALVTRAEPEFTGKEQARWHSRVAAEHDEIRRAFESCREPDADPAIGLRLAGALFRHWFIRGHWTEADTLCREVLLRAQRLAPTADTAKVLNSIGAIAIHRGHLDEALRYLQETFAVWKALDQPAGMAAARLNLGNVSYSAGDYPSASRDYAESLAIYRRLDQADGICRVLISLGNVALAQGDYEGSRSYARESVDRLRQMGHAELTAHALITLGTAEIRLERYREAAQHYQESLEIQKELGDRRNIAIATINLAVVFLAEKRLPEARAHFGDAASMFLSLGDVSSVASALEGLAALAAECGHDADAVKAYGSAAAIRASAGMPPMPDEEDLVKAVLDGARLRLGEEQVSRLFAEGQSLTADAAVEWALREIKPTDG